MAGMLVVQSSVIIVPQWLGKLLTQDVNRFHGGNNNLLICAVNQSGTIQTGC